MADKGWIHKDAFQDDALSADSTGRLAMEDGFLTNAKVADSTLTAAKFAAKATAVGHYGIALYGRAYYA